MASDTNNGDEQSLVGALRDRHDKEKKEKARVHSICEVIKKQAKIAASKISLPIELSGQEFQVAKKVRVSGVWKLCPREFVFSQLLPKPDVKVRVDYGMRVRGDFGTFLHSYFQNVMLGPAGVLYGTWQRDKEEITGFQPGQDWTYKELVVESGLMLGHVDGLIDMDRVKVFLETSEKPPSDMLVNLKACAHLEIKSTDYTTIKQIQLEEANALEDAYKCQATCYQHLLAVPKTIFIYVDRLFFAPVGFEYAGEAKYWELAQGKCTAIQKGLDGKGKNGSMPDRICSDEKCPQAKSCPHHELCFGVDPDVIFDGL